MPLPRLSYIYWIIHINDAFEWINMQLLPRRDFMSKNQLIFLKKCLTRDVTAKSIRIKPPIKSQKAIRITNKDLKTLFVLAKNGTKQRLRTYNIRVKRVITRLPEKCRNTELSLVRIFLYSNWIRRFTE